MRFTNKTAWSGAADAPDRSERNLCLEALVMAMGTTVDKGGQWYTSTRKLQIVCLDLCVACRSGWSSSHFHIKVEAGTPRHLWLRDEQEASGRKKHGSRRIPPLPVRAVTVNGTRWPERDSEWPKHVLSRLSKGTRRDRAVTQTGGLATGCMRRLCRFGPSPLWWPDTLQELTLGLDQPLSGVVWPPSLQKLSLSFPFNQSLVGVEWPASLQQLTFGGFYKQPLAGVELPASLQTLIFHEYFDQPIAGVVWPASLQKICFGGWFNQPVTGVTWPASLQTLFFGSNFDQPIAGVAWPASLQVLHFGLKFDQPITGVVWPASLQHLSFEWRFNQPIDGVIWPASLRWLYFGRLFKQSTAGIPKGVVVTRYRFHCERNW